MYNSCIYPQPHDQHPLFSPRCTKAQSFWVMLVLIRFKIDFQRFLNFKVHILVEDTWGYPPMKSSFRAVLGMPEGGE